MRRFEQGAAGERPRWLEPAPHLVEHRIAHAQQRRAERARQRRLEVRPGPVGAQKASARRYSPACRYARTRLISASAECSISAARSKALTACVGSPRASAASALRSTAARSAMAGSSATRGPITAATLRGGGGAGSCATQVAAQHTSAQHAACDRLTAAG